MIETLTKSNNKLPQIARDYLFFGQIKNYEKSLYREV